MASILHRRRNQRASASSSHRPRYTATVARLRRRARASPSSSFSQSHLHLGSSSSSSRISHRSRKNQSSFAESLILFVHLSYLRILKTIKGCVTGFAAGTIYGTILATWKDVPRVERNVALPGLIRMLKMMGTHGLTFAAIGGVYIGVEQHTRKQTDELEFGDLHVNAFKSRQYDEHSESGSR
ncbi:BnaC09g30890D [Brassica napus]|uniref:(rape) hypothetical protein n=1 Tax=Brassica napus TaxID=3708 RepID=A0A078FYU0_BRANA|nr:unnamed protein product [Brassica napus]CDY18339.1 BnaC09g30890D [Brassica napus]